MRAGVYHLVYGSEGRAGYVEWRSKSSTEQHFLMGVRLGFWIDERGGGGGGGEGETVSVYGQTRLSPPSESWEAEVLRKDRERERDDR